jgi:hypothetical protein
MNYLSMKQDFAKVFKKVATYAVGAAVIIGSITAGIAYGKYTSKVEVKPKMVIQPSIKLKDISVAVNERKEILIIDRTTGEYLTYEDSVGMAIFNMYAGRIYASQSGK